MTTEPSLRHLLEEIRDELRALRRLAEGPQAATLDTVDVAGAARLLHTTKKAIYERRRTGRMPTPITRRPLVWRKADILKGQSSQGATR